MEYCTACDDEFTAADIAWMEAHPADDGDMFCETCLKRVNPEMLSTIKSTMIVTCGVCDGKGGAYGPGFLADGRHVDDGMWSACDQCKSSPAGPGHVIVQTEPEAERSRSIDPDELLEGEPMTTTTAVGPHKFGRAGRWFAARKRCRACYLPETAHPVTGWVSARPLGDKTRPVR